MRELDVSCGVFSWTLCAPTERVHGLVPLKENGFVSPCTSSMCNLSKKGLFAMPSMPFGQSRSTGRMIHWGIGRRLRKGTGPRDRGYRQHFSHDAAKSQCGG